MMPQQQRRRRRRAALPRTAERRVVVARGVGGFGFTIAGQRPCVVSAVAAGGPAERAGLRAGDALLAVDGTSVGRAPHASVARLVATAPGAISLSVAPREAPPTDTEDTEPDERARTRRRHPPPRRRPHAVLHHPSCQAAPSTSGVNEILQNLSRAQLTPSHASRLECRAVVGYLGTIETPQAASSGAPGNVRSAVRKLRQERRPATPVLLSVLPNVLLLRRPTCQILAQYHRERILYAGCGSDSDRRFFGLVTSAEIPEAEASHSCHIFAVDPRMAEHDAHAARAREFQIACTRDPVAERCLEFPPSAEYVVGVVRGMYSLSAYDCASPTLQQISKLAIKGDSPAVGNFSRCNRGVFRIPRDRRACAHDEQHLEGQDIVANSPQPSNHSEITTTSSNSDSGIGFHNDCRNIADRILVVDFAGQQPPPNRFRQEQPRRPMGLVGCSSFDAEASFLSNTTPVVDGFGGQGRPLNLDEIMLNANDLQPMRHVSPRNEDDNYNYNNVYGNVASTSRSNNGVVYDQVYTENEGHYEWVPSHLEMNRVSDAYNSVEIYEERSRDLDCQANESVDNVTVISGGTSKASMDSVSVYSSRSHEEARPSRRKHLQASLDDMLVIGMRDQQPTRDKDEGTFLHPASVKFKVRKSLKPLNILSKTRDILTGKDRKEERRRAMSASAGDVTRSSGDMGEESLPAAASEPDLRDTQNEQLSSPFRRWTTGSGANSSYRTSDHRTLYKQMSEGSAPEAGSSNSARDQWTSAATRWAHSLEELLTDPIGSAAFTAFLRSEFAGENILFWTACEEFRKETDPNRRSELAKQIWDKHLADGSPELVNLDAATRRVTVNRFSEVPHPQDLFHPAQLHIYNVLRLDAYPRFLRSIEQGTFTMANLQRPLPYPSNTNKDGSSRATSPQPGPSGSQPGSAKSQPGQSRIPQTYIETQSPSAPSTPSRLKKSATNVSERRRSGGPSLLPWKLRVPSRERTGPPTASGSVPASNQDLVSATALVDSTGASEAASNLLTDVVKFAPLCRVVLPDGATSVVSVDPEVTVRGLVDRLLQRRNLHAPNYDVLYKPNSEDATRHRGGPIDSSAPSTSLGGFEILVERRAVVRLELFGKNVAVRCRPMHRLIHILRPVLARYSDSATPTTTAVLRDGCVVAPCTPMLNSATSTAASVASKRSSDVQLLGHVNWTVHGFRSWSLLLVEWWLAYNHSVLVEHTPPIGLSEWDGVMTRIFVRPTSYTSNRTEVPTSSQSPMSLARMEEPGIWLEMERLQVPESEYLEIVEKAPDLPCPLVVYTPPRDASVLPCGLVLPSIIIHPDFLENLRETQRQRRNVPQPSTLAQAPPPLPPRPRPNRSPRQPTLV